MTFDLAVWTAEVKERLQGWAQQPREAWRSAGAQTLFGYLAGMALFPLAGALAQGDLAGVFVTLGSIAGGVGGNLIAEQVQRWKDRADGTVTPEFEAMLASSKELREGLDAILAELDLIRHARAALPDADRQWLIEQLRAELAHYADGLERTKGTVVDIYQKIVVQGGVVGSIGGHSTQVVQHIYYRDASAPKPAIDPQQALHAYLTHVIDTTQHLRLQGIRSGSELVSIDLEEVYITLDAVQKRVVGPGELEVELGRLAGHVPGDKPWRDEMLREREVEVVLSVNDALAEHPRLVVLGAPGSGKTTFLHYLALTFARELRGDRPGLLAERLGLTDPKEWRLPVLLPLRDLARNLSATQEDAGLDGPRFLLDYLSEYFTAQEISLSPSFFRDRLEAGEALILLDGLDEVADADLRRRVARIVEGFTVRYPKNRYVVTSRIVGYQGAACLAEGFFCATVRDFDRPAVERFVHNWSLAVEVALAGKRNPTVERRATEGARALLAAIDGNERVKELAVNPLLLTVVALVHRYRAQLPERRAELYEECVEVLLGYWDEARGVRGYALPGLTLDAGDKRSLLEPVAAWMQERRLREIDREMLLRQLRTLFLPLSDNARQAGKRAEGFLALVNARSGLLQERGVGVYSFSHLTFQEYLAARALAGREDFVEVALSRAGDPWWREALLLAAGYLSTQGQERVTVFLRALMDHSQEPEPYHNLVLATDCLRDVGRARVSGDLWGEVTRRLLRDMADERAAVKNRVAAGNALGRVGDPRFSGRYLEPELVTVPAGEFWMGSESKAAWDNEKPAHKVTLAQFQIARFPITNLQYQAFVDAGGYDEECYWTAAGWAWRHGEFGPKPEGYPEDIWTHITGRTSFQHPEGWEEGRHPPGRASHPVVNITWFEAAAYCRWLADCTAKPYRLPTEAEWEKAARGDRDHREYPWGDRFDPAKANLGIGDEEVRGTSPVGIYPGGASPYGALDISGNVWEWCSTLFRGYPFIAGDGREDENAGGFRVLRGGSWLNFSERFARCSYRLNAHPAAFFDYFGFRVVVSSPSPPPNF